MIYLYWLLAGPTALLAGILILMTLAGQNLSPSTPWWLSILTGAGVLGLLWWGHRLVSAEGHPVIGVLLVPASWLMFFVVLLTWGLMHQKTWQ